MHCQQSSYSFLTISLMCNWVFSEYQQRAPPTLRGKNVGRKYRWGGTSYQAQALTRKPAGGRASQAQPLGRDLSKIRKISRPVSIGRNILMAATVYHICCAQHCTKHLSCIDSSIPLSDSMS